MSYTVDAVLDRLEKLGSPADVEGMRRYGIGGRLAFGVRAPALRTLAREIGLDNELAVGLWTSGWREARIIAAMIADPGHLTGERMDSWAADFDSWDVCDGVCNELFRRSQLAWPKAVEWSRREPTFVRRAGYVLMAQLAVHDKTADDPRFLALLPELERGAVDDRRMVAKGVNWALRQIGKRSEDLRIAAIECAVTIQSLGEGRCRWIASDALRELRSDAVIRRTSR